MSSEGSISISRRHNGNANGNGNVPEEGKADRDDYTIQMIENERASSDVGEVGDELPNKWAKFRHSMREPVAEFLGTMILIIFGTGVDCQVVLSSKPEVAASQQGSYLSISFGWAIGTALGVWVSSGISGGHINPAVTLALAVFRGFPWKKVPIYMISQLLGAWFGAMLVYANYYHAINLFEGGPGVRTVPGTAALFSTYAAHYMTPVSAFFSEFLDTAILLIVVLAIGDRKNAPPPAGLAPLVLFLLILGLGASMGMETGYAMNPARDLGPRIMTYMVGYGREVWDFRNQYWLWTPILGPFAGALAGTAVYDAFVYTGAESIFNRPNAAAQRKHIQAEKAQKEKFPPSDESV
jgi:aquaglyceroporin related protein